MTLIDQALAGRSLAALARRLKWSRRTLYRYNRCEALPPAARIVALADALGYEPDVLLTHWEDRVPRVGLLIRAAHAWGLSPLTVLRRIEGLPQQREPKVRW